MLPQATLRRTLKPHFHRRAKPLSCSLCHGIVAIDSDLETYFSSDISWPPRGYDHHWTVNWITRILGRRCASNSRSPFFTSLSSYVSRGIRVITSASLCSSLLNAPCLYICDRYLLSFVTFVPSHFHLCLLLPSKLFWSHPSLSLSLSGVKRNSA